jgi:hypothetical protein
VVDDVVSRPVEARGEVRLGDRHADGVADALPERPGRRFDSLGQVTLWMPGVRLPTGGTA